MDRYSSPDGTSLLTHIDDQENSVAFTSSQDLYGVRTTGGEHVFLTTEDAANLRDWLSEQLVQEPTAKDPSLIEIVLLNRDLSDEVFALMTKDLH